MGCVLTELAQDSGNDECAAELNHAVELFNPQLVDMVRSIQRVCQPGGVRVLGCLPPNGAGHLSNRPDPRPNHQIRQHRYHCRPTRSSPTHVQIRDARACPARARVQARSLTGTAPIASANNRASIYAEGCGGEPCAGEHVDEELVELYDGATTDEPERARSLSWPTNIAWKVSAPSEMRPHHLSFQDMPLPSTLMHHNLKP
ncbi:hypothetical protein ZWY2020_037905 [Hordeum vulgare]|nr:hypothetical protein ZWY2020_037905 [Hordeum vulgare]